MLLRSILCAALVLACAVVPVAGFSRTAPAREVAYGADALQRLDFYGAREARSAPLVVFVHGGGWKRGDKGNATGTEKIVHLLERGYAFASVDYRLVPAARVEDQAQDVADAVAWLAGHARELGIDPSRIVLAGHSAGAHLVALVATDPRYLAKAGLSERDLRGVVLLDGAAYDVPAQMREGPGLMQGTYRQAFGADPARQRTLSPTLQAAAPNAASFLILHVDREDGRRQSEALAKALEAAGAKVELRGVEGDGLRGHMAINRQLGDPAYPATSIFDAWLDATLR